MTSMWQDPDPRILVAKEKHSTSYYDATGEKLQDVAIHLVLERLEFRWYWEFETPGIGIDDLSKKVRELKRSLEFMEGNDAPKELIPSLGIRIVDLKERLEMLQRYHKSLTSWAKCLMIVMSEKHPKITRARNAWAILEGRSDHEYERIDLEYLRFIPESK